LKKSSSFLGFEINRYKYNDFLQVHGFDAAEEFLLCASCGKEMIKWLNTPKKREVGR